MLFSFYCAIQEFNNFPKYTTLRGISNGVRTKYVRWIVFKPQMNGAQVDHSVYRVFILHAVANCIIFRAILKYNNFETAHPVVLI